MAIKLRKPKVYSKTKKDFEAMWKILLKYKRRIGKKEIQIGDIIRIDYKGEYATEPQPDIIVLNPSYKRKQDKAPMLHGLAIRKLSEYDIKKLKLLILPSTRTFTTHFTKKEVNRMSTQEKKKLMMLVRRNPSARRSLINNPYDFYHKTLKKTLFRNFHDDTAYRTYFVKNIRGNNVKLLDHKYAIEEF